MGIAGDARNNRFICVHPFTLIGARPHGKVVREGWRLSSCIGVNGREAPWTRESLGFGIRNSIRQIHTHTHCKVEFFTSRINEYVVPINCDEGTTSPPRAEGENFNL